MWRHLVAATPGTSAVLDSIFPAFMLYAGSAYKSWFCDFLSSCMRQLNIPKFWRRALIVSITKPEKAFIYFYLFCFVWETNTHTKQQVNKIK